MSASRIYQGAIVHSLALDKLEIISNGVIGVDNEGKIVFVKRGIGKVDPSQQAHDCQVVDLHGCLILPGFVDAHTHAPQHTFAGVGMELQLLEWLQTYTFPSEAKFSDPLHARKAYSKVVRRHIINGTTTCSYFATIHLEASKILADIVQELGQRAFVGKVNMDRNSVPYYVEDTKQSLEDTAAFIDYVHAKGEDTISPVITPRFVPSVTAELMESLARLSRSTTPYIPVQSHLSENIGECTWVKELHPECETYAHVYDSHGLLHERTYLAHCIYCCKDQRDLLKSKASGIVHCPNSNFSISSGVLNTRRLLDEGLKVGLGTDVSGGYSSSMLDAIRNTIIASKLVSINHDSLREDHEEGKDFRSLTYAEAFYLATVGGAECMGLDEKIGNFVVGKEFDAIVINPSATGSPFDTFDDDTVEVQFQKFLFLGDDRNIERVFVRGRQIK